MEFSNKTKSLLVFICAFMVCVISTISYAYFTASVAGNDSAKQTIVQTGNMALLLTDGAGVSLENAIPGTFVTKSFKVKNTGTVATNYNVYLSEVVNDFADKNDLVYTLTSANGCPNAVESVVPSEAGDSSKIISSCNINPNQEHEYVLTINFKDDNTNQDDNKGKTFSAKLSVNDYQEVLPVIKYIGIKEYPTISLNIGEVIPNNGVLFDNFDGAITYAQRESVCSYAANDLESKQYDLDSCIQDNGEGNCQFYVDEYNEYLSYYNDCINDYQYYQYALGVSMDGENVDKVFAALKHNNNLYIFKVLYTNYSNDITEESLAAFNYNKKVLDSSELTCSYNYDETEYSCNIDDKSIVISKSGLVNIGSSHSTTYLYNGNIWERS